MTLPDPDLTRGDDRDGEGTLLLKAGARGIGSVALGVAGVSAVAAAIAAIVAAIY